jgi:hypothetical protein
MIIDVRNLYSTYGQSGIFVLSASFRHKCLVSKISAMSTNVGNSGRPLERNALAAIFNFETQKTYLNDEHYQTSRNKIVLILYLSEHV